MRSSRMRWLAALTVMLVSANAHGVPPVTYEGRAETTARSVIPEKGESTVQLGTSTTFTLRSYLWQPWFANLGATLSLSQVQNFAAQDSDVLVTSGEGRVQVFPRSRFPFAAFVGVTDSRAEFESEFVEQRSIRRTRFGVVQQYRPRSGQSHYIARLERAIEDGNNDDLQEVSDRLNLDASYSLTHQNIEASLSLENTRRENPNLDFRDLVATLRHSYRPDSELSLESFASFTDVLTETPDTELHTTSGTLTSFGVWRPQDRPLTVTTNARANFNTTSGDSGGASSHSSGLSVSANYDITRALRVSGSLSGSLSSGAGSASTSQSVTLSYNPDPTTLFDYNYNWFTSTSASNTFGGSAESSRALSSVIGHAVSKAVPFKWLSGFGLTTNANQSLSSVLDDSSGLQLNLNHGGSAVLGRTTTDSTTRLRLTVQDSRTLFDSDDDSGASNFVQSVSLQASHDRTMGRHSTFGASSTMSFTRQGFDDRTSSFPSSSLDLNYRHSRAFGINRLRFRSQLSLDSDTLTFVGTGDDDRRDITWTNQFDYSIGRIDLRLKGSVTDRNGNLNTIVFFTLSRRFGGIF